MNRAAEFLIPVSMICGVVVGAWTGSVMTMATTYQTCEKSGEVTYKSFILKEPLAIKCSASKG